jgi:hypothetical protein
MRVTVIRTLKRTLLAILVAASATAAWGETTSRVLFIRGADRSGGATEAQNDAGRTEQLGDITNQSTQNGNHGWFEFATLLETNGFVVEQAIEPLAANDPATGQTSGAPLNLEGNFAVTNTLGVSPGTNRGLADYDVVIFGSNNAAYGQAQIDAVENYIRGGGGALFISDTNFGSDGGDAPISDQNFLDRFGVRVHRDAFLYTVSSQEAPDPAPADYSQADHPILNGINAFEGEGVSPFRISETLPEGVSATVLAQAENPNGGFIILNNPDGSDGGASAITENDAALFVATADQGRIAGHFDRNTFFNTNGAGSSLTKQTDSDGIELDNDQYAVQLVTWLAEPVPEPGSMSLLGLGGLMLVRRRRD